MDKLRERPSLHGELSLLHALLVHVERVGMHSPPFQRTNAPNLSNNDGLSKEIKKSRWRAARTRV
jgi:hypothetical protein